MGRKKATTGERIVLRRLGCSLQALRAAKAFGAERDEARRIDAAIKRAVKEAFEAGRAVEGPLRDGLDRAGEHAARIVRPLEHKYGVKL